MSNEYENQRKKLYHTRNKKYIKTTFRSVLRSQVIVVKKIYNEIDKKDNPNTYQHIIIFFKYFAVFDVIMNIQSFEFRKLEQPQNFNLTDHKIFKS